MNMKLLVYPPDVQIKVDGRSVSTVFRGFLVLLDPFCPFGSRTFREHGFQPLSKNE